MRLRPLLFLVLIIVIAGVVGFIITYYHSQSAEAAAKLEAAKAKQATQQIPGMNLVNSIITMAKGF